MNLRKLILTQNACYQAGKKIKPKGIMVHSTGANNPNLCRYVGPDDGLLGENRYGNHWNQENRAGLMSVSTLLSASWRMVLSQPTRRSLGIIVDGTPETAPKAPPTTPIFPLRSVRMT